MDIREIKLRHIEEQTKSIEAGDAVFCYLRLPILHFVEGLAGFDGRYNLVLEISEAHALHFLKKVLELPLLVNKHNAEDISEDLQIPHYVDTLDPDEDRLDRLGWAYAPDTGEVDRERLDSSTTLQIKATRQDGIYTGIEVPNNESSNFSQIPPLLVYHIFRKWEGLLPGLQTEAPEGHAAALHAELLMTADPVLKDVDGPFTSHWVCGDDSYTVHRLFNIIGTARDLERDDREIMGAYPIDFTVPALPGGVFGAEEEDEAVEDVMDEDLAAILSEASEPAQEVAVDWYMNRHLSGIGNCPALVGGEAAFMDRHPTCVAGDYAILERFANEVLERMIEESPNHPENKAAELNVPVEVAEEVLRLEFVSGESFAEARDQIENLIVDAGMELTDEIAEELNNILMEITTAAVAEARACVLPDIYRILRNEGLIDGEVEDPPQG